MNERDEQAIKEAVKEMDARVLRGVIKDAVKELVNEQIKQFGWWSLKTLGYVAVGGVIVFVLWTQGYTKGGG